MSQRNGELIERCRGCCDGKLPLVCMGCSAGADLIVSSFRRAIQTWHDYLWARDPGWEDFDAALRRIL